MLLDHEEKAGEPTESVVALYDYEADEEGELTFKVRAVLFFRASPFSRKAKLFTLLLRTRLDGGGILLLLCIY